MISYPYFSMFFCLIDKFVSASAALVRMAWRWWSGWYTCFASSTSWRSAMRSMPAWKPSTSSTKVKMRGRQSVLYSIFFFLGLCRNNLFFFFNFFHPRPFRYQRTVQYLPTRAAEQALLVCVSGLHWIQVPAPAQTLPWDHDVSPRDPLHCR